MEVKETKTTVGTCGGHDISSILWRTLPEGETLHRVGNCRVPPATMASNSLTF